MKYWPPSAVPQHLLAVAVAVAVVVAVFVSDLASLRNILAKTDTMMLWSKLTAV